MFRYELRGCRVDSLLADASLFTLDAVLISRGSLGRRRVRTRRCACRRIGFPRPGLAILLSSLWWQWSVTVGGREKEEARGESCAVGGLELIARHVTALRTLISTCRCRHGPVHVTPTSPECLRLVNLYFSMMYIESLLGLRHRKFRLARLPVGCDIHLILGSMRHTR